jgi:hypothetical protein
VRDVARAAAVQVLGAALQSQPMRRQARGGHRARRATPARQRPRYCVGVVSLCVDSGF